MQVTLDLSTSILEERRLRNESGLPNIIDLSSTQLERAGNEDQGTVRTMVTMGGSSCGLSNESRGSEHCSSMQSLSVHALHRKRLADGFRCGRLKNKQGSSRKLCKDALLAPSSSCDISPLQATKQHASTTTLQGHCHRTLQFSSGCTDTNTDTTMQCYSKFRRISHNKKPPASLQAHKNRTSFYSFPNILFAYFLLISLLSPSLSLSTSLASTSPNLKSWSWAALETVDTGMERETSTHQVPIPDMTAIVGRLFQFRIPSSAFSGEVSSYKVCCSVVM